MMNHIKKMFNRLLSNNIIKYSDNHTGCPIWKATKVNLYCGYVFRVRNL